MPLPDRSPPSSRAIADRSHKTDDPVPRRSLSCPPQYRPCKESPPQPRSRRSLSSAQRETVEAAASQPPAGCSWHHGRELVSAGSLQLKSDAVLAAPSYFNCPTITDALCPPKPKLLLIAYANRRSWAI